MEIKYKVSSPESLPLRFNRSITYMVQNIIGEGPSKKILENAKFYGREIEEGVFEICVNEESIEYRVTFGFRIPRHVQNQNKGDLFILGEDNYKQEFPKWGN